MCVSPPFLFSCWKTYGKYDNFSQTWLMLVRMLLVNRAGCVKLEMHFPLTSHSPKDAQGERRRMLNYHGNAFLFCPSCRVLHSQPRPGRQVVLGRSQPIFWDGCGAPRLLSSEGCGGRLRSAAAACDGHDCASFGHGFSGLGLISELEEAGEPCTLAQLLMPDVEERF